MSLLLLWLLLLQTLVAGVPGGLPGTEEAMSSVQPREVLSDEVSASRKSVVQRAAA